MLRLLPRNLRGARADNNGSHATKTAKKIGLEQTYVIPRTSVTLGPTLDRGAFGIVYLATYVDDRQSTTGSCVAKKICPKLLPACAVKPLIESE